MWSKRVQGSLYGQVNPFEDIPRLLHLFMTGSLKLEESITRRYSLHQIQDGYRDLVAGTNIRGLLVH
jgi:S-(hydroxymethyl)glutathione dehydrogenase/alcohol dehydrogenase